MNFSHVFCAAYHLFCAESPGVGKSLLAADMAARVSAFRSWPDSPERPDYSPPAEEAAGSIEAVGSNDEPKPSGLSDSRADSSWMDLREIVELDDPPRESYPNAPEEADRDTEQPRPEERNRGPEPPRRDAAAAIHPSGHSTRSKLPAPLGSRRAIEDEPNYPWDVNPLFASGAERTGQPLHHGVAILASPEDHPAQVLIPRLRMAGARLDRVTILYGVSSETDGQGPIAPLQLPENMSALRGATCRAPGARLLVLDPLHALLSPGAQNNPGMLAGLLAELADFARYFNLTVLATIHLAKTGHSRALYNVRGSIALTAAARSVHLLSRDADEADRRILTPLKSVYGLPPAPLVFRIHPGPRLAWESAPVIPPPETFDRAASFASALSEACDWLAQYLRPGSQPARDLLKAAAQIGLSPTTLFRAKRLLNVRSHKHESGPWLWTLSPPSP